MNWIEVEAIPPAIKSVVPVTAIFVARIDVLSRAEEAMMSASVDV